MDPVKAASTGNHMQAKSTYHNPEGDFGVGLAFPNGIAESATHLPIIPSQNKNQFQAKILAMQRTYGNKAVQRYLASIKNTPTNNHLSPDPLFARQDQARPLTKGFSGPEISPEHAVNSDPAA